MHNREEYVAKTKKKKKKRISCNLFPLFPKKKTDLSFDLFVKQNLLVLEEFSARSCDYLEARKNTAAASVQ